MWTVNFKYTCYALNYNLNIIESNHNLDQGRSHVEAWGGRGPCKKKKISIRL